MQWPGEVVIHHTPHPSLLTSLLRHSLHAIASQLSPLHGCSGIELLESETFDLHCLETPTGTKFLLVVEPASPYLPAVLQR